MRLCLNFKSQKTHFQGFHQCVSFYGLLDQSPLVSFNHTLCIHFVFHCHLVLGASSNGFLKHFKSCIVCILRASLHYVSSCASSDYFPLVSLNHTLCIHFVFTSILLFVLLSKSALFASCVSSDYLL